MIHFAPPRPCHRICIRYVDLELLMLETTVSHSKIAATPKLRPIFLSNRVIFMVDQGIPA